ncbi:type I methionyl aminopeptidase [Candidatus Berkelbacteria bacterium RIFCSPLOWO2_01_FULL_50_28]|uniref:Methionine aminopeptidase n=1 Tax=Candidatus Berkelbacteria bacterium RIFCSPLOWO2_01_FULL_50_28 TaxID=1797471 RepID=A0A1F5EBY3_9BACT|nr:MAG: type I methionyl aminopeptidase [Candidatus Berkelbacteria bacterium RIFCSPHIGHO2_01_FULL_50_36]OGD62252.1 MAG: type I methionyl aminopeptidase [Candidatus Berkelbacteria bacterium RIFCSPHIGHO2_12_FULL_50_11]OGD64895.1 MAG: type I methionyl aminopeptidase [Candidatus Berkelbacteria bacterium RIFCSPLOWO2_01_FULL_50_28]
MAKQDSQIKAGKIAARIHLDVARSLRPGLNLLEIENQIAAAITTSGGESAFKGYKGYPATSCLSVNSTVVHGIPFDYALRNGDVLSVDLGVKVDGWIVDCARSYEIGRATTSSQQLIKTTKRALDKAISLCRPGTRTGDLGNAIQKIVEDANFSVVRELTGHGVGKTLQEAPNVPNFGKRDTGAVLTEGMTLAIEPIVAASPVKLSIADDDWSIVASPKVMAAHWEDSVYISASGPIVLTR